MMMIIIMKMIIIVIIICLIRIIIILTRRAVAIATVCIPFPVCLSRASLTSYSTSMVTMALSASVSKLQTVKYA